MPKKRRHFREISFSFRKGCKNDTKGIAVVTKPALSTASDRQLWMVVAACLSCLIKREGLEGTIEKIERMSYRVHKIRLDRVSLDDDV